MGVIAMKVMGGGNGCLVAGNPDRKVLRPYHDQTAHQVDAPSLIRYTLGLPIAAAVIGVASPAQLTANVQVVRQAKFMDLEERGSSSACSVDPVRHGLQLGLPDVAAGE